MLTAQVVYLKLKNGDPQDIKGNHIHGLFFKKILFFQSPELAKYLHLPEVPKSFSISYLCKEEEMYWFRIASWMDIIPYAVFSYFDSHFSITLHNCKFELIKTCTDTEESPWAGRILTSDFIRKAKTKEREEFWIEHYSPTSFKRGDSHIPLPVPELMIQSVYRQMPSEIKAEIHADPAALADVLQLKEHRLRSVYNRKNYGSVVSFNGKTRWQIDKRASQDEKEAIWILFDFAFYSGIGVKTTQGMGMCRILPERDS